MFELIRKANPDATIVRVREAGTLKRQISRAHKLRSEGFKVIVMVDDLDEVCKLHDPDTIAELLDGIPLHEKEEID